MNEKEVKSLLNNLRNGNDKMKEFASATFQNLSINNENQRELVIKYNIVPYLLELLRNGNDKMKENASGTFQNLSVNDENERELVTKYNIVPYLLGSLRNGNDKMKEYVSATFQNLSINNENKRELVTKYDIVPHLLELLTNGNDVIKENASGTFQGLSVNNENKREFIIKYNIVPHLLEFFKNGNDKMKENLLFLLKELYSEQQQLINTEIKYGKQRNQIIIYEKDQKINELQQQNNTYQNQISDFTKQINEKNKEINDLKTQFDDLKNNKCDNIDWLIQNAKSKHQKNIISNIYNEEEEEEEVIITNNINNIYNSSNVILELSSELKNILNGFNEINQFGFSKNKHLLTNQLLEELLLNNNNYSVIDKSKTKIEIDFEESLSNSQNQKQIFEINQNNLKNNNKKIEKLFDELIELQKENKIFEEEIKKSKINLKKSKIEFEKSKLIFDECEKVMKKINEINEKNKKFMEKWNKMISKGNIENENENKNENYDYDYDDEIIYGLLEYCNLDDWFNELKIQILSKLKMKISNIQPHHLMTLKKITNHNSYISNSNNNSNSNSNDNNNFQKISFGEAKYFCIVIEEIKKNKKLPKMMNDIDLNEKNIKYWTIKNVFNYFKNQNSKNMNEIAKLLFESKINGIVLLNLHENEIHHLGIENVEELNLFTNLLKQIQNSQNNNNQNNYNNNEQKSNVMMNQNNNNNPNNNNNSNNNNNNNNNNNIPPEDLICPLSHKLMIDPVIAQDGNTYERKVIEEWFKKGNNTSPITEVEIETFLIPNNVLRKQSEKWRKEN